MADTAASDPALTRRARGFRVAFVFYSETSGAIRYIQKLSCIVARLLNILYHVM